MKVIKKKRRVVFIWLLIIGTVILTIVIAYYFLACHKEGTQKISYPGIRSRCCPGLKPISVVEPILVDEESNGYQCMLTTGVSVCTKCGNGVCGPGENWCNCKADCPKPSGIKVIPFGEFPP